MRAFRTLTTLSISLAAVLTGCVGPAENFETAGIVETADAVMVSSSTTSMGTATAGSQASNTVEVTSNSDNSSTTIPSNNAPDTPDLPQGETDEPADDTSSDEPASTEAPEGFFGDVDGDGQLSNEDVLSLLASYGVTGQDDGDLNDDGVVNLTDIAILLSLIN